MKNQYKDFCNARDVILGIKNKTITMQTADDLVYPYMRYMEIYRNTVQFMATMELMNVKLEHDVEELCNKIITSAENGKVRSLGLRWKLEGDNMIEVKL
jgi:hypothetical protein